MLFANQLPESMKVSIGLPKETELITSYLTQDISIGGSASYTSPGQIELAKQASELLNRGAAVANRAGTNFANQQITTIFSTVQSWTSSDLFKLQLPLVFISLDRGIDPRIPVKKLLKCVYPISKDLVTISAPNEYNFTSSTCCSLRIGSWLLTPKIFLITSVNFSFSKEVTTDGWPLFATGTISMQSYQQIFADEIEEFLSYAGPTTATA